MAAPAPVPPTLAALSALARLTLKRLLRGRLIWVSVAIGVLPVLFAASLAIQHHADVLSPTFGIELLVLAIIPPLFAAPVVGEELEDRTATYLWSRPLPRWTILAGKLLALAPIATLAVVGSWLLAVGVGTSALAPWQPTLALAAGALGVSIVSAGIATLAPRRGMALAIIAILLVDLPLGQLPASLHWISVTHATTTLAGFETSSAAGGAVALVALSGVWLAVAFRRVARLET